MSLHIRMQQLTNFIMWLDELQFLTPFKTPKLPVLLVPRAFYEGHVLESLLERNMATILKKLQWHFFDHL